MLLLKALIHFEQGLELIFKTVDLHRFFRVLLIEEVVLKASDGELVLVDSPEVKHVGESGVSRLVVLVRVHSAGYIVQLSVTVHNGVFQLLVEGLANSRSHAHDHQIIDNKA